MKQSIGLVILQVLGIVLGLVSVFWIAGSLPADQYAIVGIYNIISTLILVFSNSGFETHAIRNILAWKEEGKISEIQLLVTQAITYRTILASLIFLPVVGYAAYISTAKFGGQFFGLFVFMGFLSISKATNDATVLLLRAFNKYFTAALVTYTVNVFGKLLALILFIKYGFTVYIIVIMSIPLIITLPVIYILREYISFEGVFLKRNIKNGFLDSKFFAVSSYISYVFNFIDQLLVSIFMNTEILGSFTVAKNIFIMSKTFIENIFDPMIQNLVKFKTNLYELKNKLRRIIQIKNILIIFAILLIPVILLYLDKIMNLLSISHYPYLNNFIMFILLAQIFLIASKIKYNFICLFFPQSSYLKITVVNSAIALSFFFIVVLISPKFLFLHIVLTNILMYFYSEKHFNTSKNPYYNEFCST